MPKRNRFQKYHLPEKIGHGKRSIIFQISDNYVAKTSIPINDIKLKNLEKEFEIAKFLFENGASVPKPEGIFFMEYNKFFLKSFIMEYIEGKNGLEISTKEFFYVSKLWHKEVERAKDLGFITYDSSHLGNFIWSPKREKVYLIDFEMWDREREYMRGI